MKSHSASRWLVIGTLSVSCLYALASLVALLLAVGPSSVLDRLDEGGADKPGLREMVAADRVLAVSARLRPFDSSLPILRGRLALYASYEDQEKNWRLTALEHFKKSVDLDPKWSLAWLELARVQFLLQQRHGSSLESLRQALQLDLGTKDSGRLTVWLGYFHYPFLSPAEKHLLGKRIAEIGSRHRWLPQKTASAMGKERWLDSLLESVVSDGVRK